VSFIVPFIGRLFVKRFALCYRSVVCLSVCNVRALWPIAWTDQDETQHAGWPQPWPHCVRWGPSSPSPKGAQAPQLSAHICCSQMAAWIKMSLGMELGLGQGDFVLDGDHAPPPQKAAEPPKFSAHVYCGQMAGWMTLVLGMQVGLSQGDFVLDGHPSPLTKRWAEHPQNFDPCLLRPNGWMNEAGTWHEGGPQPRRLCVKWRPSLPSPTKEAEPPSQFSAHF